MASITFASLNLLLYMLRCCLLLVLICIAFPASAQVVPDTMSTSQVVRDSLQEKKEAELVERTKVVPLVPNVSSSQPAIEKQPYQPNPKKSALYSAIFPGLGQINNRQYWKVPVVYVGVGVAAYFLIDNTKEYQRYRKAYTGRLGNPNYVDEFTPRSSNNAQLLAALKSQQDQYKKWLDMTYLYTGVGYILQVIDALAFAHLKNFDISQDISLRLGPVSQPNYAGIGLVMHIR